MIWFDLRCFQLVEFPLGWHTDTYRVVSYDDGAFELCLPSLGNHYQIELLRCENIHRTPSMTWSWGEDRRLTDRVTLPIVCGVCVVGLLPTVDVGLEVCGIGQARDYE